jgi:creatinine amidohydrolase
MRLAILSTFMAAASWCQGTPPMRTRYLTSLTNAEINEYLKRNDIIFVPVGVVEVHGGFPVDCEYVGALAWAQKLAEEVDGLVLPNLSYFYPGGTAPASGTVLVEPSQEMAYLTAIAQSLLRQGFRRQIYVAGHMPFIITPWIREFFDETKVPILYFPTQGLAAQGQAGADAQVARGARTQAGRGTARSQDLGENVQTLLYGAYSIVGRLEDIPLNVTEPPPPAHPVDQALKKLNALGTGSNTVGNYYTYPADHAGTAHPITAEQRAEWAKQGVAQIEAGVKASDIKAIVQALRDHDKFIQEITLPTNGSLIPK